jgi:hypothetical protein
MMVGLPQVPEQGWGDSRSTQPKTPEVLAIEVISRGYTPWPVWFATIGVEKEVEAIPIVKDSKQTVPVVAVEVGDEKGSAAHLPSPWWRAMTSA